MTAFEVNESAEGWEGTWPPVRATLWGRREIKETPWALFSPQQITENSLCVNLNSLAGGCPYWDSSLWWERGQTVCDTGICRVPGESLEIVQKAVLGVLESEAELTQGKKKNLVKSPRGHENVSLQVSLDHSGLPLGESASAVTSEEASSPGTTKDHGVGAFLLLSPSCPHSTLPKRTPTPAEEEPGWCRNHPHLRPSFLTPFLTIRNNKNIVLCPNWYLPPAESSGSCSINSAPHLVCAWHLCQLFCTFALIE